MTPELACISRSRTVPFQAEANSSPTHGTRYLTTISPINTVAQYRGCGHTESAYLILSPDQQLTRRREHISKANNNCPAIHANADLSVDQSSMDDTNHRLLHTTIFTKRSRRQQQPNHIQAVKPTASLQAKAITPSDSIRSGEGGWQIDGLPNGPDLIKFAGLIRSLR